jgi:CHAT domain-containing protein
VPRRDGSPYTLFAGTSSVKRKDLEELANEWEEWRERSRLVHPLHWERGFLLPTVNRFRQLAMAPSRAIAKWEQATNRRIRRVVVVPHRALHLLPFHLLPLEDGHAWGELYSTHYTPSLSLLSRLKTELSSSNAHTNASIVAYGPAQQRLPFLAAEARAVQETTGGTLVEGQDATPARVTRSIEDASYVHFACHATFVRETPMEAALLLAPDEASNSSGRLTLGNIVERLHFSQAPLVVLSACETGLSKIEDLHDEYIGLPAGFLYAGARTVISSLWPVSDLATWLLMSSMVRRLVACGEPPATALLHAQAEFRSLTYSEIETRVNTLAETIVDPSQREAMQSELAYLRMAWAERPFSSPYWWAGFTVNGLAID